MDRRTKIIIFIIGTILIFGLVGWFIVWPTLKPLYPNLGFQQPPALPSNVQPPANLPTSQQTPEPTTQTPDGGSVGFQLPDNPDADTIAELSRRASVLAERVESGSSGQGFSNLDDAQLDVSPALVTTLKAMQGELRKAHPLTGTSYVTVARRLVALPEADSITGETFAVTVQLQIQVRDGANTVNVYRAGKVTFSLTDSGWVPSGYSAQPFTP